MTDKIVYWVAVFFSLMSLMLFVADMSLVNGNRDIQSAAEQRQAVINAGANLVQLNQNLVQTLADVALKNDDGDILDMLAAQGISVRKQKSGANVGSEKSSEDEQSDKPVAKSKNK